MLVPPKSLFKIKLMHWGDGRVCEHKPYLLAHWQKWFITRSDPGETERSKALLEEMVAEPEKGGQEGPWSPPSLQEGLGRQEKN